MKRAVKTNKTTPLRLVSYFAFKVLFDLSWVLKIKPIRVATRKISSLDYYRGEIFFKKNLRGDEMKKKISLLIGIILILSSIFMACSDNKGTNLESNNPEVETYFF